MQNRNWVIRNARYFDGYAEELLGPTDIVIEDGVITDIESGASLPDDFEEIDVSGLTLLPGLIDAHVHVYASDLNLTANSRKPWTYLAHYAGKFLKQALKNGFTTIRDVGGGDHGLAQAIDAGLVEGPRLYYGGRLLSQTGGHADWRPTYEDNPEVHLCNCGSIDQKMAVLADGKEGVIKAVREELRRGASHIKILASGGVASPSDPVDDLQYSDEEITAIVDECQRRDAYVAAHCHPAASIERSVRLGVRSIEHGTLITEDVARLVKEKGAYVVPTMAVLHALQQDGAELGLPPASIAKLDAVADQAQSSLEIMKAAGCSLGFGTDLLGPQYERQGTEFTLRKDVFTPVEILRQATSMNAEILKEAGRLGCIQRGALADLIAVEGNPLDDIEILSRNGESIRLTMKDGRMLKHTL